MPATPSIGRQPAASASFHPTPAPRFIHEWEIADMMSLEAMRVRSARRDAKAAQRGKARIGREAARLGRPGGRDSLSP